MKKINLKQENEHHFGQPYTRIYALKYVRPLYLEKHALKTWARKH